MFPLLFCLVGLGTGVSAPERTAQGTLCTDGETGVFCKMVAGLPKRVRPKEKPEKISESPRVVVGAERSGSEWARDTVSKNFK